MVEHVGDDGAMCKFISWYYRFKTNLCYVSIYWYSTTGVLVQIIRDLMGKNICCKILKNKSIELIIIDGVGHRDFIPLVEWFHFFTKRKINKIFYKNKLNSMDEHRDWLAFYEAKQI